MTETRTNIISEETQSTLLDAVDKVNLANENLSYVRRFVSGIIGNLPAEDSDHTPAHKIIAMDCILERVDQQLQSASDIINRLRGEPSDHAAQTPNV